MNEHWRPEGDSDVTFAVSRRGDAVVFNANGEGGRDLSVLDLVTHSITRIAATFENAIDPDQRKTYAKRSSMGATRARLPTTDCSKIRSTGDLTNRHHRRFLITFVRRISAPCAHLGSPDGAGSYGIGRAADLLVGGALFPDLWGCGSAESGLRLGFLIVPSPGVGM